MGTMGTMGTMGAMGAMGSMAGIEENPRLVLWKLCLDHLSNPQSDERQSKF